MKSLSPKDPATIGPYTLLARLGEGGMGRVYVARTQSGKPIAVKVIHSSHHSPGFRKRFKREVDLAAKVRGLYTAEVIDADPHGQQPWMAIEYVPGTSLHDAVNDAGPFSSKSVRILGAGLAEALRAIHESGVLHRDFKPGNIIITRDQGPRVIDFGIAKAIDHPDPAFNTPITHPGNPPGTPQYMAPEQIRGEELSPKSDVFALGGVLYFAITGHPPFWNTNQGALKVQIQNEEPEIEALTSFRALILQCLEKDPEQRPTLEKIQERFGRVSITENASLLPPEARHRIEENQRALRSWDSASRIRGDATEPGTQTGHPSSHSTIKEESPPTKVQSEAHRKPTSDDPKEAPAPFPVSLVAGCAAILLAVPLLYTLMGWLGLAVATWAGTRFESAAGLDIPALVSWAAVPYSFQLGLILVNLTLAAIASAYALREFSTMGFSWTYFWLALGLVLLAAITLISLDALNFPTAVWIIDLWT